MLTKYKIQTFKSDYNEMKGMSDKFNTLMVFLYHSL